MTGELSANEQLHVSTDLTNCDREPIHLLGAVQSFGLLIAFSSDWIVTRVSDNVAAFVDREAPDVLGISALEIIDGEALHAIRSRLQWLQHSSGTERLFRVDVFASGRLYDLAVHLSGGSIILEIEPSEEVERVDALSLVRSMMSRLRQATNLSDYFAQAARQVRAVTGFDRVMVYRFLDDNSGEVIAEARSKRADSYLGLRYPASDIPRQARELYKTNIFRIIANVEDSRAAIVPQFSPTGAPLDLSQSLLRAVSPIHLEYLRNMGVGASMSISIVIGDRLWGLIACHHLSPRLVSLDRRTAMELFADMFSQELFARQQSAAIDVDLRARAVHDQIMVATNLESSAFENLRGNLDAFLKIINADGCAVWIENEYALVGTGLDRDEARQLVRYMNRNAASRVFATNALSEQFDDAAHYAARASGVLAIPVSRTPRDYLLFFRREVAHSVNWAGNPNKPVETGSNGIRLTPRKSFEAWRTLVRHQSSPWTTGELRMAESLRVTLLEVILRSIGQQNIVRQKAQETQDLLIAELNHRVRNILTLIGGIVAQTGARATSVDEYAQLLSGRLQSLGRAHDQLTVQHWGAAPIARLAETEFAGYFEDGVSERVRLSGGSVCLQPKAYTCLALVLHELVTNSAKYGALSGKSGEVALDWSVDDAGSVTIAWTESGGPPVTSPERRGFGTTLIERAIPYELEGEASIEYALGGVRARFVIPAQHVDDGPPQAPVDALITLAAEPAVISGGTVLLVEDNVIIAMDAETLLLDLGFSDVILANSVDIALSRIADSAIDCAVLDINLGKETAVPVAARLAELEIPYIFASGYGDNKALPMEFKDVPVVSKPYSEEKIRDALAISTG